jgi:hypothetical protein
MPALHGFHELAGSGPPQNCVVSGGGIEHFGIMKGRYANAMDPPGNFLVWALVISLLIHLLSFGVWKLGKGLGWWRNIELPQWMQLVPKSAVKPLAKKIPARLQATEQTPLLFVDVDPAMAAPEPPKNAKYYSSADSVASNPAKKIPSDIPLITGKQDKVLKTTEPLKPKAQPLQPSPPVPQKTEVAEAKAPVPEKPQTAEAKPLPKKSDVPGDLAMAKPRDKVIDKGGQAETQPTDPVPAPPKHTRPRTLAEALQHQGLQGEKMRQDGGVNHISLNGESSLDVKRTVLGDYDRDMIAAVDARWHALLADRETFVPGKVVLEFKLHTDGRITDMKVTSNEVTDLLSLICEQAVLDPAPFKPWPDKMRQEISAPRDVVFTFFYYNE